MKHLLATTAAALVISTSAMAESHTAAFSEVTFDNAANLYASEVIGMRVYATESDINNTVMADGETEWDDIGEINEIILTRDGEVQSVIVGVGGFLGMGEKDVAVSMDQIKFVTSEDDPDDVFLVISANTAGVQDAPAYERQMHDDDMVDTEADLMETDDRQRLMAPAVEREGYQTVEISALTTEDLTGARVYGPGDEDVGEIGELLLTDSGEMDRAVIDVGGFLGMGEHNVAVTFDELQITRSEDGDVRVYIDSSQEALEAQPEYEG